MNYFWQDGNLEVLSAILKLKIEKKMQLESLFRIFHLINEKNHF